MMIVGAATIIPSDRLPCEIEVRLLSAIKQQCFLFQTHPQTSINKSSLCGVGRFEPDYMTLHFGQRADLYCLLFSEPSTNLRFYHSSPLEKTPFL